MKNNFLKISMMLSSGIFLFCTKTYAADAIKHMNAALQKKDKILIAILWRDEDGILIQDAPPAIYNYASVVDAQILEVIETDYSKPIFSTDQIAPNFSTRKHINCSSQPTNFSMTLSVTTTDTISINRSQVVSKTKGASVNAGANFKLGEVGISFGASTNYSVTSSVTKGLSKVDTTSNTVTQTISGVVAPMTAKISELVVRSKKATINYKHKVLIDGKLRKNASRNTKASDLLSEEERTVSISGKLISVTQAGDAETRTHDLKLSKQDCNRDNGASASLVQENIIANKHLQLSQ